MRVDGVDYNLETNNGPNHLHGGSHGFGTKLWEGRVETNRVVFSLVSEDGDGGYPGEVCVEATAVYFAFGKDKAAEMGFTSCELEGDELLPM